MSNIDNRYWIAILIKYYYFFTHTLQPPSPTSNIMYMPNLSHKTIKIIALFLIIAVFAIPQITSLTQAAALTEASIQLDRMITSNTDTSVLVVVKPATTATEARIKITFSNRIYCWYYSRKHHNHNCRITLNISRRKV